MKRATRSFFLAMRASSRFGRAVKLRDRGKSEEALKVAREALAILSHPHVVRFSAGAGAVLSCATVLVEELATELGTDGAGHGDIVDSLSFIRAAGPTSELARWVPHLEHKAAHGGKGAA
jgi:hypothetical protein